MVLPGLPWTVKSRPSVSKSAVASAAGLRRIADRDMALLDQAAADALGTVPWRGTSDSCMGQY